MRRAVGFSSAGTGHQARLAGPGLNAGFNKESGSVELAEVKVARRKVNGFAGRGTAGLKETKAATGANGTSLVGQMRKVMMDSSFANEQTIQIVEQLRTRIRRLQRLSSRYAAVDLSRYVEACVASLMTARPAGE